MLAVVLGGLMADIVNGDKTLHFVGVLVSLNLVAVIGTYFINFDEVLKYKILLVQFLLVAQFVSFFAARYVWVRICPPLFTSSKVFDKITFVVVGAVLVLAQCSFFLGTIFTGEEPHWISILTYCSLGILIIMTTVVFLFDVANVFTTRFLRRKVTTRFGLRIRTYLILISSAILSITALANGRREVEIKRIYIPLKNLPSELNGLTIVQLSDIHVGPTVGRKMLEKVVKLSNSLNPDVVALTGDLVDGTVYQMRQAMKPLLKLKARYGSYFVTGNHEYYTGDIDGWLRELNYLGIVPLRNSHVTIKHPRKQIAMLCLAGVDDVEGSFLRSGDHGMNLDKALAHVKPNTPVVLLTHQPKAAVTALNKYHDIGLVLSGHTHGGQLFPIHIWHLVLQPYFQGLYKHRNGAYVYVSSGVHFWGMPMRLWSTAEVVHFTLVTTKGSS